jgi:Skp family chaperone for outer membrane proteins
MKKLLLVLLMVCLPLAAYAEGKGKKIKARVAMVDVDRCVGETEDGLRAKAALGKYKLRVDAELFAREERLKAQEARLQEMLQAHQKSGSTTPDPKMQSMAMDYQKDLTEYQTLTKKVQGDLANYEDQLFLPIEKKIKSIFTKIAEAEGYDLIVDRRSMPITLKPELDLTERVIKEYNWGPAALSTASAKPAASPAPSGSAKKP